MEIILLEHVDKLGKMGDKVNVKNGYARNYLLPQNKALRATEANVAYFEKQKAELEAHNKQLLDAATAKAEALKGYSAVLIRQAAETGQLYGSVTIRDIAAAIKASGFDVERRCVYLENTIKDLGVYEVKLNLHPEVSQTILVNVARTEDEAKKTLTDLGFDVTVVYEEDTSKDDGVVLKQSIERRKKLLANVNYVNKAPQELVEKERKTLAEEEEKLENMFLND